MEVYVEHLLRYCGGTKTVRCRDGPLLLQVVQPVLRQPECGDACRGQKEQSKLVCQSRLHGTQRFPSQLPGFRQERLWQWPD